MDLRKSAEKISADLREKNSIVSSNKKTSDPETEGFSNVLLHVKLKARERSHFLNFDIRERFYYLYFKIRERGNFLPFAAVIRE